MMKSLKNTCPFCSGEMVVSELTCRDCGIQVRGEFNLSPLSSLTPEQQEFVIQFLRVNGNIKEMERILGVSYPTIKSRLEKIMKALDVSRESIKARQAEILDMLESGKLKPGEAAKLLKRLNML